MPACLLGTRRTRRSNRAHRLWYGPVQFDARAAFLTVYRELICFEEYHRHLLLRAAIWDDIAPCAWFFAHAWYAAELQAERSKSTHARGRPPRPHPTLQIWNYTLPSAAKLELPAPACPRVQQIWSYPHRALQIRSYRPPRVAVTPDLQRSPLLTPDMPHSSNLSATVQVIRTTTHQRAR